MGFLYHNSPFISTGDFPRGRHKAGSFGWIEGERAFPYAPKSSFLDKILILWKTASCRPEGIAAGAGMFSPGITQLSRTDGR